MDGLEKADQTTRARNNSTNVGLNISIIYFTKQDNK